MAKKFLMMLAVLGAAFLLASCGRPKFAEVGKLAPDFRLTDRQGKTWNLDDLKGKVVFINFWATWCAPCREEMPSMQRLGKSMPPDQFVMLTILNKDEPKNADSYAEKTNLTLPILVDSDNKASQAYGLTGVPETFIIDKQGVLREKFIGPVPWDAPNVQQRVRQYLGAATKG